MSRILVLAMGLLIASIASPALADHPLIKTVRVDCAQGETISAALAKSVDDDKEFVVEFTGTCEETVSIPRDDVTIRGLDPSATLVGRVTADGVVRLTVSSFTIRDTPPDPRPNGRRGDAILLNTTLGVTIDNMRIIHPGGNGITTDDGQIRLRNITVTDCGGIGIASGMSGSFLVGGTLVTNRCQNAGIQVGFGSQMTAQTGAIIESNDNVGWGILVQTLGQLSIFRNTTTTILRNGVGIQVSNKGSMTYGDGLMDVSDNRGFGILVGELADMTPFGGIVPNLVVRRNGVGIGVIRRSFIRMIQGDVSNNLGPGLLVDASDVAIRGTSIHDNAGPSALVTFDSTATFDGGNVFDTAIVCDSTSIARGQFTCPASPLTAAAASEWKKEAERWLAAGAGVPQ